MGEAVDLSGLGNIDFTPSWARQEAKVSVSASHREKFHSDAEDSRPPRAGHVERKFEPRKRFPDRKVRFEPQPEPLDAEVKVLPEPKALGTIIRKLQGDFHAYKLKDLAYFFLDKPEAVTLRIAPKAAVFHQCKACGFASTSAEEVLEHAVAEHLSEYFDSKVIDVEPPKGNFNCVARCGLSGVLLGPPNIHEFNAVVRDMIREHYPQMSEAEYRSRIEMVREPEVIEQWRQGAVKKTVFFAKGQAEVEGAKQYSREQAEGEFRRNYLAPLVDKPKVLVIPADQALKGSCKPLVWAARDALEAERRAPYGMLFALRGAFHHRKLNFFRANDARGPEFVTGVEYKEFDVEHAIPELAAIARFVAEHPCCDVSELPKEGEALKQLQWLVSTGHVVAFTNGVYSAVEKYPKYGPQWKKRKAAKEPTEGDEGANDGRAGVPPPAAGDGEGAATETKEETK